MFRGLAASSVFDANYLVSGGIERLVLEWKVRRGQLIDERDGRNRQEDLDPDFYALLRSRFGNIQVKISNNIDRYEYRHLAVTLSPFESGGPGDTNKLNLFDQYLRVTPVCLSDPHNLSSMIERWKIDVVRPLPPHTSVSLLKVDARILQWKETRPSIQRLLRRSSACRPSLCWERILHGYFIFIVVNWHSPG